MRADRAGALDKYTLERQGQRAGALSIFHPLRHAEDLRRISDPPPPLSLSLSLSLFISSHAFSLAEESREKRTDRQGNVNIDDASLRGRE